MAQEPVFASLSADQPHSAKRSVSRLQAMHSAFLPGPSLSSELEHLDTHRFCSCYCLVSIHDTVEILIVRNAPSDLSRTLYTYDSLVTASFAFWLFLPPPRPIPPQVSPRDTTSKWCTTKNLITRRRRKLFIRSSRIILRTTIIIRSSSSNHRFIRS